jgi:hypothetical protein
MIRNTEGGLDVTDVEALALAFFIASRSASPDLIRGPEWGDYPELSERSWQKVTDKLNIVEEQLLDLARTLVADIVDVAAEATG